MREIKFKGKRPNSGKWITGSLVELFGFSYIVNNEHKNADCSTEVLPETVAQFTGLKDKNGKEIYEGDVMMSDNFGKGIVIWNEEDGAFFIQFTNYVDFDACLGYLSSCELIGNIHDEELLKD